MRADPDPAPPSLGRWHARAAVLLLVGAALGGCGDDGSVDGTGASAGEFAAQISVTCKPYTSELTDLVSPQEEAGGELGFRRYGQVLREGAGITDELLAELQRLEPPKSAADAWDRYLDALAAVNDYRAELGAALGSAFEGKRGLKGLRALGSEAEVDRRMDEAGDDYDQAVEALDRAGISSDCFSEVIGEGEVAP